MFKKPTYKELEHKLLESEKTVEALKENEKKYRRLSENSPDILYRMSLPSGMYEYVSPEVTKIFGYPPEEWYENPLLIKSIIHPDFHSYFGKQWEDLLDGHIPPTYEYKIIHKDKTVRWVNQRNKLVKDDTGHPVSLEGIVTEITDRKQAEEALKQSDEKYKELIDNINSGVAVYEAKNGGKDFVFLDINKAGELIDNIKKEDLIGQSLLETYPKVKEFGLFDVFERVWKTGEEERFPISLYKDNRLLGWRENFVYKMSTGEIVAVYNDVTDSKINEEALRQNEERLHLIIKGSNDAPWDWDLGSNEIYYSPQWWAQIGYAPDELPADSTLWEKLMHPDDAKNVDSIFRVALKDGIESYKVEFRLLHKDGHYVPVLSRGLITKNESGDPIRVTGTNMDLTERKKGEKEKRSLEKQLQQSQKMESIGTLAGGIAHEFNNMLAIIMGNNELIFDELPQGSLARESTEEIRIAGLRARDVVKQLLTFSRQDNAVKKVMDFKIVVQESMKLIHSTTPANVEIKQNLSADTCPVMGNGTQINQLLLNLCNNAVDALPKKGGKITIELINETIDIQQTKHQTKLNPGQYAKLMVSDNGIGMDNQILDRIFEPYFTTKDIGKGSGIGMAVVHGIVEKHGGVITVDSKPDQGTTFTIYFPAHEGLFEQETKERDILPVGDENILYVDDEPSLAKLGKRLLDSLGYTTESITDPGKALDMVRNDPNKFDLLITDMAMPNMTGEQLVIETLKIRQNMPIIICTGYSANISGKEAADIGVRSFIMKPINKSELAKMVRKVLDETKRSDLTVA